MEGEVIITWVKILMRVLNYDHADLWIRIACVKNGRCKLSLGPHWSFASNHFGIDAAVDYRAICLLC